MQFSEFTKLSFKRKLKSYNGFWFVVLIETGNKLKYRSHTAMSSLLLLVSHYISAVRFQIVCRFICSFLACSLFACLLTNGLPLKTPTSKVTIRSCTKVVFRGPAPVRSSRTGRWPMKSVWTPWRTSSRKPGSLLRKPTRNTMRSLYGSLDVVWFGLSCLQYACNEYFIKMPSGASSWIINHIAIFHTRSMCSILFTERLF